MGTLFRHFQLTRKRSILKNIVNCAFWSFCLFGVYFLFVAGKQGWVYPHVMGSISLLSACLVSIPFIVYHKTSLRAWYRERFVGVAEFLIGIPLAINGLGAVYFFDNYWMYDTILHFTASLFFVILMYVVIGAIWRHQTPSDRILLFFITVIGSFLGGIFMEAFEITMDASLQTSMWGQIGEMPWNDTISDIVADTIGITFGAFGIFFWGRQMFEGLRRVQPRFVHARDRAVEWSRETRAQVKDQVRDAKDRVKEQVKERMQKIARV